jgi:hypothetical protein
VAGLHVLAVNWHHRQHPSTCVDPACQPYLLGAGSLLVVPMGIYKPSAEGRELNTAYVYARGRWGSPVMHLPGHNKVGSYLSTAAACHAMSSSCRLTPLPCWP